MGAIVQFPEWKPSWKVPWRLERDIWGVEMTEIESTRESHEGGGMDEFWFWRDRILPSKNSSQEELQRRSWGPRSRNTPCSIGREVVPLKKPTPGETAHTRWEKLWGQTTGKVELHRGP